MNKNYFISIREQMALPKEKGVLRINPTTKTICFLMGKKRKVVS